MSEAQITCLCVRLRIADLGLNLQKGDVVYVPQEKARQSKDLARANSVRGVEVLYLTRCRKQVDSSRPKQLVGVKKEPRRKTMDSPGPIPPRQVPVPPVVETPNLVDTSKILVAMQKTITTEIRRAMESLRKGILQEIRRLRNVQPSSAVGGSEDRGSETMVPTFIPSNLVGGVDKATIKITSEKSEGLSVESATAALMKARRRGKDDKKDG